MARGTRVGAELLTVFVGVYLAFLFNNYQAHRQERERREQLLVWLEETCQTDLDDTKSERAVIQAKADDFNRRVQAGEMPALHAFTWLSSYDPRMWPACWPAVGSTSWKCKPSARLRTSKAPFG